jgi:hypothetical protein
MKNEFHCSSLEGIGEALIDFENVYESGRLIKQTVDSKSNDVGGTFIVRNGKAEPAFASEKFAPRVEKLYETFNIIRKTLSPRVTPNFVELSVFDPDDPTSDSFYTILFGSSGIVRKYLGELKNNIAAAQKNSINRGVLLPSPALYQSAHYSKRYYEERILCEKLALNNLSIYFGSFKVTSEYDDKLTHENFEKIRYQVENFFDAVMKEVIKNANGKIRADFASLVPIVRPVGISRSEAAKKMRGGGLFIFGEWKDKSNYQPGRAALRILNILNRAVMNVSQARIESVKALDALHEHAYDTQGHELRKLTRWIANGTPKIILDNLRMYFTSLFAISEKDVDKLQQNQATWIYPKEYAEGETLEEFIKNAATVAFRVESMIAWCESHSSREGKINSDDEIEKELNSLVEKALKNLVFEENAEARAQFEGLIETGFKNRWYFFGALVSAFRNIPEHQEPFTKIIVSIDKANDVLIINNQGKGDIDAVTGEVKRESEKEWRGSTGSTLKFFVIRYNENPEKVSLKWRKKTADDLTFLTIIPLPKNFLGATYEKNLLD